MQEALIDAGDLDYEYWDTKSIGITILITSWMIPFTASLAHKNIGCMIVITCLVGFISIWMYEEAKHHITELKEFMSD